jgi:hypothetical protein
LAGHSAQGKLSFPDAESFLMLAPPVIEEILNRVQNDVLDFGIFRDENRRRLQLKLNP